MDTARRRFLTGAGLGVMAAAMSGARAALAQPIRVLPDLPAGEKVFAPGVESRELRHVIEGVRLGAMRRHGALAVFWLGATAGAPLEVVTLDEARTRGDLLITERAQARVPDLVVENRGGSFVLLLAGEILVGGKQNRVLSEDILLPPKSGPRSLGVYCVEQGRWDNRRTDFESKASFAPPAVRSEILARRGQDSVWGAVGRSAVAAQAPSPTSSLQSVYDKADVREHMAEVERVIEQRAPATALGAAVFVGPRLAGLDLFFDAGLFGREWPKILRSYAVDLYGQRDKALADEAALRARVQAVLGAARVAEGTLRENAGVGRLFEFRGSAVQGAALVFEGRVVHTAMA
jgi:hypothetical protein